MEVIYGRYDNCLDCFELQEMSYLFMFEIEMF